MVNVVILHAAEDALPARALAEKLRSAKLNVSLETQRGEPLQAALKAAQLALALWSPRAVTQDDLAEDAWLARGKGKLIHVSMQNAQPPELFSADRMVNLTGWRGEDDFPAWRELAQLVTEMLGVAPLPPPRPRAAAPSGFFQPGRPETDAPAPRRRSPAPAEPRAGAPPPRREPLSVPQYVPEFVPEPRPAPRAANDGGGRGLMLGVIAFAALAAAGGGGYFFWNQTQSSQTAAAAWEDLDVSDPGAVRAFLLASPGAFRDQARSALRELEERGFEAASDADTAEALREFLRDFPDSEHAIVARGRLAELATLAQTPTALPPAADPLSTDLPDLLTPNLPAPTPVDPDLLPPSSDGPAPLTPQPNPDEPIPNY